MSDLLNPIRKDALISDCGTYRYWLSRSWDDGSRKLAFVMLNPSTADASIDDPTIRRCMGFAKRERFGGILVVNLYALRATDPSDLLRADDPIGPRNEHWLREVFVNAGQGNVVCAWGTKGGQQAKWISKSLGGFGCVCLGKTKDGHPRHPLYVKSDQPFEAFP